MDNSLFFFAQVKSADACSGQSSEECPILADGTPGREQHQSGGKGGRGESNAEVLRGVEGDGYIGTFQLCVHCAYIVRTLCVHCAYIVRTP